MKDIFSSSVNSLIAIWLKFILGMKLRKHSVLVLSVFSYNFQHFITYVIFPV